MSLQIESLIYCRLGQVVLSGFLATMDTGLDRDLMSSCLKRIVFCVKDRSVFLIRQLPVEFNLQDVDLILFLTDDRAAWALLFQVSTLFGSKKKLVEWNKRDIDLSLLAKKGEYLVVQEERMRQFPANVRRDLIKQGNERALKNSKPFLQSAGFL